MYKYNPLHRIPQTSPTKKIWKKADSMRACQCSSIPNLKCFTQRGKKRQRFFDATGLFKQIQCLFLPFFTQAI